MKIREDMVVLPYLNGFSSTFLFRHWRSGDINCLYLETIISEIQTSYFLQQNIKNEERTEISGLSTCQVNSQPNAEFKKKFKRVGAMVVGKVPTDIVKIQRR
jgi:hypothetical protein